MIVGINLERKHEFLCRNQSKSAKKRQNTSKIYGYEAFWVLLTPPGYPKTPQKYSHVQNLTGNVNFSKTTCDGWILTDII